MLLECIVDFVMWVGIVGMFIEVLKCVDGL